MPRMYNDGMALYRGWAHQNAHPTFAWQPKFYDHIIRDQASLDRIRAYILDNPRKWDEDEENPKT